MKNNKAVIYARLSREDENKIDGNKESRSIENQISSLTSFCAEKGFDLVDIYYDDGYTGANLDRPDMQRMLKDIKMHKFDIVVVKDVSRLGRSLHKVGELIDKIFPNNNIRLISVSDKYDSLTYREDESIIIRNFLNEYYLKEFKKKCRKSLEYRVNNTHLVGFPKFGYYYDEDGNEQIDEEAAKIIRMIYDYVGNREFNLSQVAKILNDKNIQTRSCYQSHLYKKTYAKKKIAQCWDRHAVNDIASDYEYCGHSINLVCHKYKKTERVIIKNTHLAIIDEDLYNKTQKVIKRYKKVGRNGCYNHIANLLKDCHTGFSYVYCPPRLKRKSKACYVFRGVSGSINADVLHEVLYQDAMNVIKDCQNNNLIYNIFRKKISKTNNCDIGNLKQKLDKLNEAYSVLLEKYFNGFISEFDFNSQSFELQNKIKDFEEKIKSYNQVNEKLKIFEIRFKKFLEEIKILPTQKLDIIRLVIKKVIVNKIHSTDKFDITICYKFE